MACVAALLANYVIDNSSAVHPANPAKPEAPLPSGFFVIFAVSLGGGNKGVTSTLLLFRRYHFNIALANGLGLTIPVGQ